jgi:succinylarginine dihydrolase
MILKEKIFHELFDDELQFKKDNILPRLSDIADEFAIGFANWCSVNTKYDLNVSTDRELLEIYKKEISNEQ